jgi:hypothetical protein
MTKPHTFRAVVTGQVFEDDKGKRCVEIYGWANDDTDSGIFDDIESELEDFLEDREYEFIAFVEGEWERSEYWGEVSYEPTLEAQVFDLHHFLKPYPFNTFFNYRK